MCKKLRNSGKIICSKCNCVTYDEKGYMASVLGRARLDVITEKEVNKDYVKYTIIKIAVIILGIFLFILGFNILFGDWLENQGILGLILLLLGSIATLAPFLMILNGKEYPDQPIPIKEAKEPLEIVCCPYCNGLNTAPIILIKNVTGNRMCQWHCFNCNRDF